MTAQEFQHAVEEELNSKLPANHQARVTCIDSDYINKIIPDQTILTIDDSVPMLTSLISMTSFYKSNDVSGAANYLLQQVHKYRSAGELVFKEDYKDVLDQYRPYFDRVSNLVRSIASKYDSDMTYDLDDILSSGPNQDYFTMDYILSFNKIRFSDSLVSVSYALGFDAVDPKPFGLPKHYTDGSLQVGGPTGIYYNGNTPSLNIKYFDADIKRLSVALEDYFKALQVSIDTQTESGYKIEYHPRYEDNYLERNAQQSGESKIKRSRWSSVVSKLEKDLGDGYDPLYDQTDAGSYINSICTEVEDQLHYYVEPSVQAGQGGVWIYDESNNNEPIVEDYDYQDFNETVMDLALASKNMSEFKKKYKDFILSL